MNTKKLISAVSAAAISLTAVTAAIPAVTHAENPIIQTAFTPDPAPVVFGDELWMFTGRDRDADNDFYYMTGWQAFSTTDMKNWTNHGCILEDNEFSWCTKDNAWASQCIERNGKYYFYFTTTMDGGRAVGVGVADKPEGPYKDVLGKPLCGPNWDYIDPTVIIDDDGQAWLMFGNPKCYYVKLKEDMVTLDGQIKVFDMNTQSFGQGKNGSAYGEGPWIYKHDSRYYLVYAGFYGNDGSESMCYSYGPSVTGPWTFGGQITPESSCFTTHGGIIDYKGHSYMFYHTGDLPGGGSFKRSAAVEEFTYNSDGTIPKIKPTKDGPDQIEYFDPYRHVEAETGSWFSGLQVESAGNGSQAVGFIENGDYIKVSGVDFGDGAKSFTVSAASDTDGGKIELHLDSATGPIIGTVTVTGTGGWQKFKSFDTTISGAKGVHDLYIRFAGDDGYLMNVDWWEFDGSGASSSVTPTTTAKTTSGTTTTTKSNSTTTSGEILFREDFESGAGDFSGRGSASVAASGSAKYEGSKSLLVTDRADSWNGATMELPSSFKAGTAYSFSVNAMSAQKNTFYLTLQYDDASGDAHYDKIAKASGTAGDWVQLSNRSFTIPGGASNMHVYVETDSGSSDFYIDDLTIATAGTKIKGAGNPNAYTPGDATCDGTIDAFDVVAVRQGLLKGTYKSDMAKKNADADKSGEIGVNDLVLIADFALGKITEFPDNSPEPVKSDYQYNPNITYKEAPGNYFSKSGTKGKLIKETYNGINGTNQLNVYLPPDYDESKQYNIFYLMHGGGENENVLINDTDNFHIDYLVDHMIQNGEVEPMIMVFPTFNKTEAGQFYSEFRKSVVPFVEGKYSTYAGGDTSDESLKASRMHRAYGGFSMGAVSTWAVFANCLDIVGYYMPLSGDHWSGNSAQDKANDLAKAIDRSGLTQRDYFIFAATGDDDIAYPNIGPQIEAMKPMSKYYTYTSDFSEGNLYFLVAPGKTHWWGYVKHYIYDGLPNFFRE